MAIGKLTVGETTLGEPSYAKRPLYERSIDELTWYLKNLLKFCPAVLE